MDKIRPPMRARTGRETREKGVGGEPVESRLEAVEVALGQVIPASVYGSDINRVRAHAGVILGYIEQWDRYASSEPSPNA